MAEEPVAAAVMNGVESDEEEETRELTAKELQEIERKRQKAKKKKASKKRNKKKADDVDLESDSAVEASETDAEAESAKPKENGEQENGEAAPKENGESSAESKEADEDTEEDLGVDIDYVAEELKLDSSDPNFAYFSKVLDFFKPSEGDETTDVLKRYDRSGNKVEMTTANKAALSEQILQEEMNEKRRELEESGEVQKMSRRKMRLSMQPSIAKLKEETMRPDVVEWADVTSRDPVLLVILKAYRNTVPVPRHWNAKRKYLAGKRGFERAPFELPEFIKRTGIMEMRESMWEKEENQSLKGKMRERARPKLGKIDIDYQKLHDAFFKWQTKPVMTKMGELYYEGKELETQMREKKPGTLSDELRIALGMPVGPNSQKFPPPWLIAMQRYGPPPSYPNLKIPGLNSPIPEGCAFGYHAGGWGKPPVDEYGKPLYGDVFGLEVPALPDIEDESKIERKHWGEMGSDVESSDEESEEEEDVDMDGEEVPVESGFITPAPTEGFATPSGMTSGVPVGAETPDNIEFRKKKGDESVAGDNTPAPLYTVLPEKRVERLSGQMMASTHVYDINAKKAVSADGIELSLNPEDLDMSDMRGLEQKYEEQLRKQKGQKEADTENDDLSDMVAEHSAKQNRKRKAHETKKSSSGSEKRKSTNFKF
uniref:PSP domain-containing protein n=1 Tax=Steinernema glaseri TaxID=37863 RepID=A0A1I8AQQ8_9BILA